MPFNSVERIGPWLREKKRRQIEIQMNPVIFDMIGLRVWYQVWNSAMAQVISPIRDEFVKGYYATPRISRP